MPGAAWAAPCRPGGALGPVPGYVASRSTVGTKTDTPILETAQSVSVIGRKQIEDQNALTINQALRYTPSVTTEQRGGAGSTRLEQFYIRGFTAPLFLDGLALPGSRDAFPSVDPFRLERIDIIKGPASVLYGQSGPGGIVNLVSKVPQFVRHGEIFVQGGGFNEVRGGLDVGGPIPAEAGPLADQFAYRVIAGGWNGDGPAVTTQVERVFINPSVTWRPSTDTQLTVIGNYQRDPFSGFYGGFPAVGTVFPRNFGNGVIGRLPVDFYDGDRNFERSDRTQGSISYLFDHRINEHLRFHSAGRYLYTEGDYRSVFTAFNDINGPFSSGPVIGRSRGGTKVEIDAFTIDNNVVANFDTGFFAHTALLGVDHRTFRTGQLSGPFPAAPGLNALAPNYDMNIPFPDFTSQSRITAEQTGVYFQDQAKFDRLVLTLGGRYDVARQTGPTRTLATGAVAYQDVPADAFTGRASLLYLFDSGVAPYVSYSEAFEPIVNGRIFDTAFGSAGRIPDPSSPATSTRPASSTSRPAPTSCSRRPSSTSGARMRQHGPGQPRLRRADGRGRRAGRRVRGAGEYHRRAHPGRRLLIPRHPEHSRHRLHLERSDQTTSPARRATPGAGAGHDGLDVRQLPLH